MIRATSKLVWCSRRCWRPAAARRRHRPGCARPAGAGRLRDRGVRRRARRALADARRAGHGLRRHPRDDRVYALRDEDGDGRAERVVAIASGLDTPNGVAFRDGALYVAEMSRITRYDDIEAHLDDPPAPVVIRDDFPTDTPPRLEVHRLRPRREALRAGRRAVQHLPQPMNPLYASHHAHEPRRQRPARSSPAASATRSASTGTPRTGELWFTDNGRDWLGDDVPPDELNRAPRAGLHFGFPFFHGDDMRGSRVRRPAPRGPRHDAAGPGARRPRRGPRHALLHRHHVPRRRTAARSSSPSTAPGTAARRSATGSRWCASTATARSATSRSPPAGCAASRAGAARSTCW